MRKVGVKLSLFGLFCMLCAFEGHCQVFQARDATVEIGVFGEDVVDATVSKINTYLNLKPDYSLLKRLALLESSYGEDTAIINNYFKGGIWQITASIHNTLMLFKTGRSKEAPAKLIKQIESAFNIDCFLCSDTYNTALRSGLAARIYIEISVGKNIPKTITDQSLWWSKHYNSGSNAALYVQKAQDVVDKEVCDTSLKMDIWFLLDGSGSMSATDFETALNFTTSLSSRFIFNGSEVRFGFSVFSFYHVIYFRFIDDPTKLAKAVASAKQPLSRTEIGRALEEVLTKGFSPAGGARGNGVSKVLVIITDGKSTDDIKSAVNEIHEANITVFAVGIGSSVEEEEIALMATNPDTSHAFYLSNFNELISSLNSEMYSQFCRVPIRLEQDNPNIFISLRAGAQQHVALGLPPGKQLQINFSTSANESGGSVFLSAGVTEPNSAFYDLLLVLKKGWNEILIRASDLLDKHPQLRDLVEGTSSESGVIPIYMTIRTTQDSDLTLGSQVRNLENEEPSNNTTNNGGTNQPINLNALWLSLAAVLFLVVLAMAINFYRRSNEFLAKRYRQESKRNTEETLMALEVLHAITIRARRPTATLSCLVKLREQLDYAKELQVDNDRLKESHKALHGLSHVIDVLRKDLKKAAKEAAKPNAGAVELQTLEELLEYAEHLRISRDELVTPKEVCSKLKEKVDWCKKELVEWTAKAKLPFATIFTLDNLEEKIKAAQDLKIPEEIIKLSREVLENLKTRIFEVKKDLKAATDEAESETAGVDTITKLEDLLKQAEALKIPPDYTKKSDEILDSLKNRITLILEDLEQVTSEAKKSSATKDHMQTLSARIKDAERIRHPKKQMEGFYEVLQQLKTRDNEVEEAKKTLRNALASGDLATLQSVQKSLNSKQDYLLSWDPSDKELAGLFENVEKAEKKLMDDTGKEAKVKAELKRATTNGKKPAANIESMKDLTEKIKAAEEIDLPSKDMKEPYEVLEKLKRWNEEVEEVKTNLKAALASNDLESLQEAQPATKSNKKYLVSWNPDDTELTELLEQAKVAEDKLLEDADNEKRVKAELKRATTNGKKPAANIESMKDLTEKIKAAEEIDLPSKDMKEAYEVLEKLKKRNEEVDEARQILKAGLARNDLDTIRDTLASLMPKKKDLLQWDPSDDNLPELFTQAKELEKKLNEEAEKAAKAKKRDELREKLRTSIDNDTERDELKKLMRDFEAACDDGSDPSDKALLAKAKAKVLGEIKQNLLKDLLQAVQSKNVKNLKASLSKVDKALEKEISQQDIEEDPDLHATVQKAKDLLEMLTELEKMREAVMRLKQTTISEIRSYSQPPAAISKVMEATFLLLGHSKDELKEWTQIQALIGKMGKESLKRRIGDHQITDVTAEAASKASSLLTNLVMKDVEEISKASAVFFAWAKCILQEHREIASTS